MINQMIFPAPSPPSYDAATISGHKLLHIPRPASSATASSPFTLGVLISCPASPFLILYAHPNAVDVGHMVEEMEFVSRRTQCSVLLWEYQGYGLLQDHEELLGARHDFAEPGEEALNDDMSAVYTYCLQELRIPSTQIILMGRSIGTGPSVWLASKCRSASASDGADAATPLPPPLAVFLQAPFTSIVDCCKTVARQRLNMSFAESLASMVVADRFRNIDAVPLISCPVWIQHGSLDEIVHISHSIALVEAARAKGKNDVVLFPSEGYHHNNLSASETARLLTNLIRKTTGQWTPTELRLKPSEYHLLNPPLSTKLLRRSDKERVSLVSELLQNAAAHWAANSTANLLVFRRTPLKELLLVNLCAFTCRLARLWQQTARVLQRQRERLQQRSNQSTSSLRRGVAWLRSTLTSPSTSAAAASAATVAPQCFSGSVLQMLEQLIAVRGSPFGIYRLSPSVVTKQTLSGFSTTTTTTTTMPLLRLMDLVVRPTVAGTSSSAVPENLAPLESFSSSADVSSQRCETVTELHWPNYLLRDVVAMVESAPDVLAAGVGSAEDPFFFLTCSQVDRLQRQMERFIGFLPDVEWARLQRQAHDSLRSIPDSETLRAHEEVHRFENLCSLQQVEEQAAAMTQQGKPVPAAEYDALLSVVRRIASPDGLLHQTAGDGIEVVLLDPSWSVAWHLHREFVAAARRESSVADVSAQGAETVGSAHIEHHRPRKADDDCCVM